MAATMKQFVFSGNMNFRLLQAFIQRRSACSAMGLAEVGIMETPKLEGNYNTGQLFLHRVFGYRGAVLFSWAGKLFDRNVSSTDGCTPAADIIAGRKKSTPVPCSYYTVLIDSRDIPYVRLGTEMVTFLSNEEDMNGLYSIPGLDYVGHEDMLPYQADESQPIHNHLFDKFLQYDPGERKLVSRGALHQWHGNHHPWLEMTEVHRETTDDIRVTVMPFFIGSREVNNTPVYWWRYSVRLENLGQKTVQLRERHWRIYTTMGALETVRGRGIVGKEPVLSPGGQCAFQYTSHVSLLTPGGHMWGTFSMERDNGTFFDCKIPSFSLESQQHRQTA